MCNEIREISSIRISSSQAGPNPVGACSPHAAAGCPAGHSRAHRDHFWDFCASGDPAKLLNPMAFVAATAAFSLNTIVRTLRLSLLFYTASPGVWGSK